MYSPTLILFGTSFPVINFKKESVSTVNWRELIWNIEEIFPEYFVKKNNKKQDSKADKEALKEINIKKYKDSQRKIKK
jgi:hypothetical protein